VGFAGTVFTGRFELGVLTPPFPLHDDYIEPLARAFKAFRVAFKKLQQVYQNLISGSMGNLPDPDFPYLNHYKDKTGDPVVFKYNQRLTKSRLIFLAMTPDGRRLFIKFTHRYGEDAHHACSDARVAPHLYAVEATPGGWFMVVMEYLDPTTFKHVSGSDTDLKATVDQAVDALHDCGFVHGDLRDCNMMCGKENGVWRVLLLDFDWAGRHREVRYPININAKTVTRPEGVVEWGPILREHDRAMIELVFSN